MHQYLCSNIISLDGVLIFVSPNNTIATFNTSIVFTCTAIGISSPDITWLKDGTSLSGDFNITEDRLSSDGLHFITLSVLTLCDLESSDSGQYSCVASNNISTGQVTDSRDFTLEVQGESSSCCDMQWNL